MNQAIEFGRSLLSYGVVMLVAVVVMAVAITIGINLAKKKNAKMASQAQEEDASNE